jgi:hypothetical protein
MHLEIFLENFLLFYSFQFKFENMQNSLLRWFFFKTLVTGANRLVIRANWLNWLFGLEFKFNRFFG